MHCGIVESDAYRCAAFGLGGIADVPNVTISVTLGEAIVSKPGISTERNAGRIGFTMGYARLVLIHGAAGLESSF